VENLESEIVAAVPQERREAAGHHFRSNSHKMRPITTTIAISSTQDMPLIPNSASY
jgi:hypothetical protein